MSCLLRIFAKVTVPLIRPILSLLCYPFLLTGPDDYVRFDWSEFLMTLAMQPDERIIQVKSSLEFIPEEVPFPPELCLCDC